MAVTDANQSLAVCGLDADLVTIGSHVLTEWFPSAEFEASPLQGGRSGAAVLRLDVRGMDVPSDASGVYILKLTVNHRPASEAPTGEHLAAAASPAFAELHIPRVVKHWSGKTEIDLEGSAQLYELAGGSLRRYTTGSRKGSTPLLAFAATVARSTLDAWCRPANISSGRPIELLESIVGPEGANEALALASDFYGPSELRYEHGHVFLSPTSFLTNADHHVPLMRSFQHGDFHTGNILLPHDAAEVSEDFWIIDFERACDGFVGLDLAYLELSVISDFFDDATPSAIARCLDHVELPERRFPIPDDLHWLAHFMRATRDATADYARSLIGRQDDLERQLILARITEGLRWARRHRGRRKSHVALIYAGWYAAAYERLYPSTGVTSAQVAASSTADSAAPPLSTTEKEVWDALWQATGHLARRDWAYVLVAERLTSVVSLGSLGNLPWAAIVDLDPNSDNDGLYSQAGPVLAASRAVHVYSDEGPTADTRRGTLWLMSAGWRLRREPHVDFRQWFRTRFKRVRTLFESLRRSVGDQNVILVALLGDRSAQDAEHHEDRLLRVLEAFDETWEGRGAVHVVGESEPRSVVPATFYPLSSSAFVEQLGATFGSEDWSIDHRLPSTAGPPVIVQQDTLRVLQEHFEVLHDRIALSSAEDQQTNDEFWRGGQILWSDLAEDIDVPRAVAPDLHRALIDSLDSHRTHTVVLQHRPGAGGTTAALRAAWDLHWKFPVAVLRPGRAMTLDRVSLLADRLQRLFILTETPVLFVAESGDLPEAYREALYRELSLRNARITTLYIRRSLLPNVNQLSVSDPLTEQEARLFLARYRQLTDDDLRTSELQMLGTDAYERYRTPFFFGLITFQRDFAKIGEYVDHHLRDVAGRTRDVLAHLSLVSLYSNSGLQLGLLQHLFRLAAPSSVLSVEDLFGAASPLVVQRGGRYRIAHQLLAEEVLARLVAPSWNLHLNDLALDFIEDVCAVADTSAEPLHLLFRQIFIDRVSGPIDGTEDRGDFAPIIAELDSIDPSIGHQVLHRLAEQIPDEPHFWNHLGRHQVYRLRRDLDVAERYLETAIDLSPDDSLHHHTLGLARRGRLRQGLRTAEGQGAEAVVAVIDAWFSRTVECFERSRSLSPDDIYGYITHVQTILDAARALRSAAHVDTVAEIRSTAGDWLVEQLTVANTLLDDAAQLYGTLDRQDDYLQQCLADIHRLYGNLDGVVRLWELDQASGESTAFSRRALAQAYYIRAKRSWRGLTSAELTRVASLAEDNLRRLSAREEDYRLWFEARKLLPDFDLEQALAHLELWSARLPTWRSAYYRYVLHFLLWFSQRSDDARSFQSAQEECARLVPGRTSHSYAWLAKDPRWCPLVADSDLGEWDRHERFWGDTSLLQRVNGVIDVIHGPGAGSLIVGDRRVHAFFVPVAGGFLAHADENTPVNFFLGFSPSGLRAWNVQRGHDDEAATRLGHPASRPEFVSRPRHLDYEHLQAARARELHFAQVRALTRAFLDAAFARGGDARIDWLEERLLATVGLDSLDEVRHDAMRLAIESLPGVTVEGSGPDSVVRQRRDPANTDHSAAAGATEYGFVSHFDRPARWGMITKSPGGQLRFSFDDVDNPEALVDLRRNSVVEYLPSSERRTERALHVLILGDRVSLCEGRVIEPDRLPELVASETRRFLEAALIDDRASIAISELEDHLERTFRGGVPLGPRLGVTGLRAYFRGLPWMSVQGPAGAQTAAVRPDAVFGRTRGRPERTRRKTLPVEGDRTVGVEVGPTPVDALQLVVAELRTVGADLTLQNVGSRLKALLGADRYARFVGTSGLKRAIKALGGWSFEEVRPGVVILGTDAADAGSAVQPDPEMALTRVVAELMAQRREPNLQLVGPRLKALLGPDGYVAFTRGSLKRAIAGLGGGWTTTEVRPGVDVVSREIEN